MSSWQVQHSHHSRSCMFLLHSTAIYWHKSIVSGVVWLAERIDKCGHSWSFDKSSPLVLGQVSVYVTEKKETINLMNICNKILIWALTHVFKSVWLLKWNAKRACRAVDNYQIFSILSEKKQLTAGNFSPAIRAILSQHMRESMKTSSNTCSPRFFSQLQLSYMQF